MERVKSRLAELEAANLTRDSILDDKARLLAA
jgi:hypothetical protein